ncbi:MAG: response regulator [Actinobacteria bacterium]|nr:response regulator [Actinomycetota bacterium]MBU1943234.1 response regulator [Actinomycetota bacterium]MBU2685957.1 response regulator [Actinomycetota bacterium]
MEKEIKILLIEDNPADADLLQEYLGEVEETAFSITHVETLAEGLEHLSLREADVVLLDLSLPDSRGFETFTTAHARAPRTPIIVLSGLSDEQLAVRAVQEGAQDYLVKGRVDSDLLVRAIHYGIERQRMLVELDGFAHTVSHDLKGPLTAIKVASDTLLRLTSRPTTETTCMDIDEIAVLISRNVDKASALIKDILSLAEAGQVPKEVSEVDVRQVVERVLEEKSGDIREKGVEVAVDEDLGHVIASPTHIYQVFLNLIGNSISHNDSPSPRIEVSCLGRDADGRHRYQVSDNGPGIPPDMIDRIFIPFTSGRAGGTGIGLSIVDKITRVYDGSVTARNEGGACFEFSMMDYRV